MPDMISYNKGFRQELRSEKTSSWLKNHYMMNYFRHQTDSLEWKEYVERITENDTFAILLCKTVIFMSKSRCSRVDEMAIS